MRWPNIQEASQIESYVFCLRLLSLPFIRALPCSTEHHGPLSQGEIGALTNDGSHLTQRFSQWENEKIWAVWGGGKGK